jgi:hypothetical protein
MDNRKQLHYKGDIADEVVGQIVGPNLFGELFVADEAIYDRKADVTTVKFRWATQADIDTLTRKEMQ